MAGTMKGLIAALGVCVSAGATAQEPARLDPERLQVPTQQFQIDPSRLQIRDAQIAQTQTTQQFPDPAGYSAQADNGPWVGWINFNRGGEPSLADGGLITRIFEDRAGGVRFGFGVRQGPRLLFCETAQRACGNGAPSGGHVLRNPDGSLRIDFARPVQAVTMSIAPDRRTDIRAETFQIEGWANGDVMLQATVQMPLNANGGPSLDWAQLTLNGQRQTDTRATSAVQTGPATEFDYVIVRGFNANGGEVNAPFLIDDLRWIDAYGPDRLDNLGIRAAGLRDMLRETERSASALRERAQVIRPGGRRENSRYPVAERVRLAVDFDAADEGARRQRNFVNVPISLQTFLGRRERLSVPILAPLGVFSNENPRDALAEGVAFMGRRDFYHLIVPTELGEAVITGTRLASPSDYGARNAGSLMIGSGYDGAYASFNLYGAAYSVRITCQGVMTPAEGVNDPPPCNDPAELESLLDRLFLFLPRPEDR